MKSNPKEIGVRVIRREIEDGLQLGGESSENLFLNQKIDEYLLRMGFSNADVQGITVELLTKGKVRVDFRDYNERLVLVDPANRMPVSLAIRMYEDYAASVFKPDSNSSASTKIFHAQPPRSRSRPTPPPQK